MLAITLAAQMLVAGERAKSSGALITPSTRERRRQAPALAQASLDTLDAVAVWQGADVECMLGAPVGAT
jgi:hypothetical protein